MENWLIQQRAESNKGKMAIGRMAMIIVNDHYHSPTGITVNGMGMPFFSDYLSRRLCRDKMEDPLRVYIVPAGKLL